MNTLSQQTENLQNLLTSNSQKVSSSLKLILILLKLKCPISDDGFKLLQLYVDTEVENRRQDIGWMDITHANITHLIQNTLLGKTGPV